MHACLYSYAIIHMICAIAAGDREYSVTSILYVCRYNSESNSQVKNTWRGIYYKT